MIEFNSFNPEKQIKSKDKDLLNRKKYADSICKAILNYNHEDSYTIGIYGKWGDGKTSFVNLIMESFVENNKSDNYEIIYFNPWNFSNHNELIDQFFRQIVFELKIKEDYKEIIEYFEKYVDVLKYGTFIPEPKTALVFSLAFISGKIVSSLIKTNLKHDEPLIEIKEKINKKLKEKQKKLIIIIDDIDRLNDEEIRYIIKFVKLVADFSNTTYVLLFDPEIVISALIAEHSLNSEKYLEKIINIPIQLPAICEEHIFIFFNTKILKIIEHDPTFNEKYWREIYPNPIIKFFTNIRDINRFLNIFEFNYSVLYEEVNVFDLLIITVIQVFNYKIYLSIIKNKSKLISSFKNIKKEDIHELDKLIQDDPNKNNLIELLVMIFPMLSNLYTNTVVDLDVDDKHISNKLFFDKYFLYDTRNDIFPIKKINELYQLKNDKEKIHNFIKENINLDNYEYFVHVLTYYSPEILKDDLQSFTQALISFNWEQLIDDSIFNILDFFVSKVEKTSRVEFIKNISSANLFQIIYFVRIIENYMLYKNDDNIVKSKTELEEIIDKTQIDTLKIYLCNELYKKSHENLFLFPCEILWIWEKWDGKKAHEQINRISSDDMLLIKTISISFSDLREYLKDNSNYLPKLLHIENPTNRFTQIFKNKDKIKFSDKEKKVVDLLSDHYSTNWEKDKKDLIAEKF